MATKTIDMFDSTDFFNSVAIKVGNVFFHPRARPNGEAININRLDQKKYDWRIVNGGGRYMGIFNSTPTQAAERIELAHILDNDVIVYVSKSSVKKVRSALVTSTSRFGLKRCDMETEHYDSRLRDDSWAEGRD